MSANVVCAFYERIDTVISRYRMNKVFCNLYKKEKKKKEKRKIKKDERKKEEKREENNNKARMVPKALSKMSKEH